MAATVRKQKTSRENLKNSPGGETLRKNGVPVYGWYRMPDDWWEHLPRLQRGLYQRMLIEFVWASTVPREEGAVLPEWSPMLSWSEMAARFRCSCSQLHDDARDAHIRGLIQIKDYNGKGDFPVRGGAQIKIRWDNWGNIKKYDPPKPELVEKVPRVKVSSHWFSKRVTVAPGESYDFTVPDLPADFTLQKISFRNTGDSESVTIAGGGPADGGVIVLETEAEKSDAVESKTYEKKRESTPQSPPKKRESTPQSPPKFRESTPQSPPVSPKISFSSPLAKTLAKYGIVSDISLNRLVAECQAWAPACSMDEIEQAARVKGDEAANNPKTRNVAGVVLSEVPKYFNSEAYKVGIKPAAREKKDARSEREKRALEIWGGKVSNG